VPLRDRIDYTTLLLVLSGLLLCVPLFDMWRDIVVFGESPVSTLLENSVVVLLSGSFVWLSVWLLRNEREARYSQIVARWSILGTGCVALAYGWVLGFQLFTQSELKPYIIAADGVVIGGLVLFIAGVYNARSERESTARAAERDRFSALFDNTSDAIAAVESTDDGPVITAVNEPFERVFGIDESTVAGRSAVDTVAEWAEVPGPGGQASDSSPAARLRAVNGDPEAQAELCLKTPEGPRDYLIGYVPIGDAIDQRDETTGFLMFTDITPQKEREQQFETLSEGAEGLLNARSVGGAVAVIRTLVDDLFDDLLVGIWRYEPESDAYRPLMLGLGGADAEQMDDVRPVPIAESEAGSAEREPAAVDGDLPAFDATAFGDALAARGVDVQTTTVRALPAPYRLTVSRGDRELSSTDRHLIDLFVANAQAAIRRVNREEELTQRNDQLEFVNSLLRHDIQNSMTVIRARGEALSESLSDREADYARTVVDQSDEVIELIDQFRVLLNALTDHGGGNTEAVRLAPVLEDRVKTLETTHPDVEVTVDVPEGIAVSADDMLGNVFGNVLGNAVEHNDTDAPTVDVSVAERDRRVVVEIADDGPGVPDDQKSTIFRRGNRGLKESDIGSGFGLFFVDTMMKKYGGDVSVTDNDPEGAVFTLSFRKAEDEDSPE